MNLVTRLLRADDARKTRLHTGNGRICLHPIEISRALATTTIRIAFGHYARLPWLVYSATSCIAPLVQGKRVFEFGSGMSTLWFADRAREVVSVDDNREWAKRVVNSTRGMSHARLIYAETKSDYLRAIEAAGGKFDVILIDGSHRMECVHIVRSYLNTNGMVIVDNTDVDPELAQAIRKTFADSQLRFFLGWAPGILHPNETTVIQNIPVPAA